MQSPDRDWQLEELLEPEFTAMIDNMRDQALKTGFSAEEVNLALLSLILNRMRADRADKDLNG